MRRLTAPSIAVVIPVYRAHYLAECLASVFAQTLRPTQIIVVDDGSPDREVIDDAVTPYRHRLTLLRQENLGAGAARNRGVQHASTDLVAFLDADDLWCPHLLESQVRLLAQQDGPVLVYANGRLIGDGPLRGMLFMDTAPSTGEPTVDALLSQRCTVLTSSVVVQRTALIAAGLFDEALRRGQDFDMWLRVAAAGGRLSYTTEPLVYRRIHDMNLSGDRLKELSAPPRCSAGCWRRSISVPGRGACSRRGSGCCKATSTPNEASGISRPERSVTPRRISVKPPAPAPAGKCRSSTLRFGSRRARRSTPTPSKRGEVPRRKSPERSAPT